MQDVRRMPECDRARGVVCALATWFALSGAPAAAQDPADVAQADSLFKSVFVIDQSDPEARVPNDEERNRAPVAFGNYLMNLTEAAQHASEAGDHAKALKFYRALAKAVPDRAVGFSKLCAEYLGIGDRAQAEQACATALTLPGVTVEDHVLYVHAVLRQPEQLTSKQTADLDAVVAHLKQSDAGEVADELSCLIGLKMQSVTRLGQCVSSLRTRDPNSALAIRYEWRLAIAKLDRSAARRAVARAKQYQLPALEIQRMELATNNLMYSWERSVRRFLPALLPTAIALLAIVVWFAMRRRSALLTATVRVRDSNTTLR